MRRRAAGKLVALAALAAASGRAWADGDGERYTLRAELGAEVDSNAHRTEIVQGADNPPPVHSAVARGVLSGTLSDVVADGQSVAMSATVAGKLFGAPAATGEDVLVAESGLGWRRALGTRGVLSLAGSYYEAFQRPDPNPATVDEQRDFRSLTPTLRVGYALSERADAGISAGYRLFVFKPDRDFDFQAPVAALDLRWARESADGAADWDVVLGASFERRAFAGPRLVDACTPPLTIGVDCLPSAAPDRRLDDFLMTRVEATRTGRVLAGAGYAFHYNRSNSYGETVQRHFVIGRFGAALPLELFFAARAEVLFASYAERVILAEAQTAGRGFLNIEDENRSSLRVDLSRNLTDRLQLIARYTYYTDPLGVSGLAYSRHTGLLSLAFTIEK